MNHYVYIITKSKKTQIKLTYFIFTEAKKINAIQDNPRKHIIGI